MNRGISVVDVSPFGMFERNIIFPTDEMLGLISVVGEANAGTGSGVIGALQRIVVEFYLHAVTFCRD